MRVLKIAILVSALSIVAGFLSSLIPRGCAEGVVYNKPFLPGPCLQDYGFPFKSIGGSDGVVLLENIGFYFVLIGLIYLFFSLPIIQSKVKKFIFSRDVVIILSLSVIATLVSTALSHGCKDFHAAPGEFVPDICFFEFGFPFRSTSISTVLFLNFVFYLVVISVIWVLIKVIWHFRSRRQVANKVEQT